MVNISANMKRPTALRRHNLPRPRRSLSLPGESRGVTPAIPIPKTEHFRTKRVGGAKIEHSLSTTRNHRFRTTVRFCTTLHHLRSRTLQLGQRYHVRSRTVPYGHPYIFLDAPSVPGLKPAMVTYGQVYFPERASLPPRDRPPTSPRQRCFSNRLVTYSR